jgi:hypothetical protein
MESYDMKPYDGYKRGQLVDIADGEDFVARGTIVSIGSEHATVTLATGASYDVPYQLLRQSSLAKQAAAEVIREEEKDGKIFTLVKEETSKDGKLAVQFKVLLDNEPISESEELVTNVYDVENGWSAPDDFDENKVDLIKSTYESGFDLVVDSYGKIEQNIMNVQQTPAEAIPAEPQGTPAFAPGAEPAEIPEETDSGNLAGGPEAAASPAGESGDELPAEAPETSAEPEAPGEATAASLLRQSFARTVLSSNELLRNPQHRLNPVLRAEMDRRGIDSGKTNDLELAEELKDFDF